jgi:hypothetical protein
MLDWLAPATDPYDAQERVRAESARRGADDVAVEVHAALADPATPSPLRDTALGIAGALADDVASDALAAELLVHVARSELEPPESAFAMLARRLARSPSDPRLLDAVRAVARRSRQPRYDARHGRDWLERCVRQGTLTPSWLARFEDAVEQPDPPSPAEVLFVRACSTAGPTEIEALIAEVGVKALSEAIADRSAAIDPSAPEAPRLASLACALRDRLPASDLRGRLAAAAAHLHLPDFQIAFPLAVAALADRPHDADLLALVTEGFENSPDVFDDADVERIARAAALDPRTEERLRGAIADGRAASA